MTERIEVGRQWKKVSDGTQDVVIQFIDTLEICRSAEVPAENAAAMRFHNTTLTVTTPDVAWVRSSGLYKTIQIVIW
ncbi:hypothetical protein KD625_002951 [Salmonella enterica subsp. enterica serovar Bonariensis]|nr:hypothetical protein [Salmonella enterica subsp. enterica serovar Bonariensis]